MGPLRSPVGPRSDSDAAFSPSEVPCGTASGRVVQPSLVVTGVSIDQRLRTLMIISTALFAAAMIVLSLLAQSRAAVYLSAAWGLGLRRGCEPAAERNVSRRRHRCRFRSSGMVTGAIVVIGRRNAFPPCTPVTDADHKAHRTLLTRGTGLPSLQVFVRRHRLRVPARSAPKLPTQWVRVDHGAAADLRCLCPADTTSVRGRTVDTTTIG